MNCLSYCHQEVKVWFSHRLRFYAVRSRYGKSAWKEPFSDPDFGKVPGSDLLLLQKFAEKLSLLYHIRCYYATQNKSLYLLQLILLPSVSLIDILFKAGNAFLKVQILGMRQQNCNLTTLILLFPLTYRCSQNCKMFVDYSSKKPILRSHYFYLSSSKLISKPLIVMTTAVQQRLSDNNFPHLCKP